MESTFSFATIRLGKTSVNDITKLNSLSSGALSTHLDIQVVCTQVPQDLPNDTYVFIWLGSDNSKGIATEWKQGFKAVGRITKIDRGENYSDESTTFVEISYVFPNAVNRLDILREAAISYYWCSSMPIIGIDDHSNQTIRSIATTGERTDIRAFLYTLCSVDKRFKDGVLSAYPELISLFDYSPKDPRDYTATIETETIHSGLPNRISCGENVLLYGVPGAGKSWTIQHEYCSDDTLIERLVFHPDYTYSDFVGQILPISVAGSVKYEFTPGPFTRLLKRAYEDPAHAYYLIIEEINRGNAPAIFGDVFQLLDRTEEERNNIGPAGSSEYGITNADVADEVYGDSMHLVRIPSNMSILATMNTADQNVFTLDTAFQRRWHMRMIANSFDNHRYADTMILDTPVTWRCFCTAINQEILLKSASITSAEDKRLGAYFISESVLHFDPVETDETKSASERLAARKHNRLFAEKVIKYLWDDAFKYYRSDIFEMQYNSLERVIGQFMEKTGDERLLIFKEEIRNLLLHPED